MEDFVIGLDISTSACKALALNHAGQIVAEGRAALEVYSSHPGWFEQLAGDWWNAVCQALQQLWGTVKPAQAVCLAIAHQRESFVVLDKYYKPLRPAILWLDQRGVDELPILGQNLNPAEFHQRTGKPLTANLAPPKIAWLQHNEPQVFNQTAYYLDTHAYLILCLTGEIATSSGSADPLGLFDLSAGRWDEMTLACLNLDQSQMPGVFQPGTLLGKVRPLAAEQTGLPEGLPVVAGLGDGQAGSLGSGVCCSGLASLSLGTSVIGGIFSPTFGVSQAFRTMTGGLPGSFIFETVLLSGTQVLNWFIHDLFGQKITPTVLEKYELEAREIRPGAEGLILVPYWSGAMNPYWDPTASGIITGLRLNHGPAHLYRAVLEGIAFELRLHLEGVEQVLIDPIQSIIVGGGGSSSRLWRSILADCLGKSLRCAHSIETAALGVGMLAAAGTNWYSDVIEASSAMIRPSNDIIAPNPERHLVYTQIFERSYRPIYPALHPWRSSSTAF